MRNSKLAALRAAFPYTVPIFAGFWFLAMAYGIQMSTSGFAFWYPMVMSAVIMAAVWNSSPSVCSCPSQAVRLCICF